MDYIKEIDNLAKKQQKYLTQLLQEVRVYKDPKYNYGISVDNDSGGRYRFLPYFKFSKGKKFSKSKDIARIPIKPDSNGEYKYQIHENGIGRHFDLKSDEFDILNNMLHSTDENGESVWIKIITTANSFITQYDDYQKYIIPLDTPIPEYKKLLRR